jgi:hypothetical protein
MFKERWHFQPKSRFGILIGFDWHPIRCFVPERMLSHRLLAHKKP